MPLIKLTAMMALVLLVQGTSCPKGASNIFDCVKDLFKRNVEIVTVTNRWISFPFPWKRHEEAAETISSDCPPAPPPPTPFCETSLGALICRQCPDDGSLTAYDLPGGTLCFEGATGFDCFVESEIQATIAMADTVCPSGAMLVPPDKAAILARCGEAPITGNAAWAGTTDGTCEKIGRDGSYTNEESYACRTPPAKLFSLCHFTP